jgi:ADP-ribosyl-[dinitrogen reductase] hydrolase
MRADEETKVKTTTRAKTSESHPLRIDWLPVLAGRVGMTFCPGKHQRGALTGDWARDLEADLEVLSQAGTKALLSVIEPHELVELRVPNLGEVAVARGIEWHLLPVPDVGVPDAGAETAWADISRRLAAHIETGESVVVHCKGGLGRTGMFAARILIELEGLGADEASARCREVRPGTVETAGQERYLRELNLLRHDER